MATLLRSVVAVFILLDVARHTRGPARRLFLRESKGPPARLDFVDNVAQHLNLAAHPLRLPGSGLHPPRRATLRRLGGDVGYLDRNDHRFQLVLALAAPPEVHDEAGTVFAENLLDPANGVAVAIEQEADAA